MFFILIILLVGILFLPNWWAKRTIQKFSKIDNQIPGNGDQFARHLIKTLKIHECVVEIDNKDLGSHYDPTAKRVVLSSECYSNRSLSSLVIAAHEVSHALQDHLGSKLLSIRTNLATMSLSCKKIASFLLIISPVLTVFSKAPIIGLITIVFGMLTMAMPVLLHIITLPVELDASFNKALPILRKGYIKEEQVPSARKILLACALTYFASSLASLLNFWQWIRILRR